VSVAPAANLALGRSVVASSTAAGAPGNVVDGDPATSWTSGSSDGQWLYLDLGGVTSFDRVRLNWGATYGVSYAIQVSNDASSWATLYDTTAGAGGVEDLSGLAGQGRYVRLWLTGRSTTDGGYVLNEFSVYAV
jgi:hexosaminidase